MRLQRQKAIREPRNDDGWLVAKSKVAQWVNKLNVMEDKREVNLKKFWVHLAAARKYAVDFTNLVELHKEMIAELPWPVRHGRALSDRQGRSERPSADADSASDGGHSEGGAIRGGGQAAQGRKEPAFCKCAKPLPREIGEHPRGILRLSHLRADSVGSDEGVDTDGRSYARAVTGQSSTGRDRAQTRLPLRTNKTVTWARVLEQAVDDGALVGSAGQESTVISSDTDSD